MIKSLFLVVFTLLISSCMSSKIHFYKPIDLSEKSITMPPGGSGLMTDVKQTLIAEGWQIKIDRGSEVIGEKASSSNKFDSLQSRYRLHQNANIYDVCLVGGDALSFDISMVDNKDSAEVFTWSGRECSDDFLKKLRSIAKGEQPKK